jgi:hypothetical protein
MHHKQPLEAIPGEIVGFNITNVFLMLNIRREFALEKKATPSLPPKKTG